ncbi:MULTISPECIES: helix-turn-helix domain-containing protein [Microbacterium]|uniref:helix-turn-helix domain-containing protein n=1 Tax=Microbacterium TaxID=33882 RepID=UPI00217D8AE8|nr:MULTISPECIES: helix-turn-helix domain-containing protein [Microbacterium]UWF78049.1 AraC family transcriptional regulator [Microbacterium neungamense]WCM56227.1 AraC family transcriptional regulator [Microbacterium sp. EF45047]
MVEPTRGILFPRRLPDFRRLPAPPSVAHAAAWFWIPEWDLAPGEVSPQAIVGYPALNLVVEGAAVTLCGATTRAGIRELRGRGWAVGALLRPAAVARLIDDPASLRDRETTYPAPELQASVARAMASGPRRHERAVSAFAAWLAEHVGDQDEVAAHANAMADLLMGDPEVRTPEQAAARLAVSVRTLQRMAHRFVGLPPAAMIRRRRLQEAAERVRNDPAADLASIAAEFGYADHAHLAREFRAVLGFAPSEYRARLAGT